MNQNAFRKVPLRTISEGTLFELPTFGRIFRKVQSNNSQRFKQHTQSPLFQLSFSKDRGEHSESTKQL